MPASSSTWITRFSSSDCGIWRVERERCREVPAATPREIDSEAPSSEAPAPAARVQTTWRVAAPAACDAVLRCSVDGWEEAWAMITPALTQLEDYTPGRNRDTRLG